VIPVLTGDEYRRVDKAHEGDLGIAMEKAGYAVALAAARHGAGYGSNVVVLAGPGNNGGDGYVAARFLKSRGAHVEVHALAEPATDLARTAADAARASGVPVVSLSQVVEPDIVIDSVFGGGARRGLPDVVLAWMRTRAPVIAVDFPTGLDPDTGGVSERAFHAVETVTFSTLKTGHVLGAGPEHSGDVTVAQIGITGGEPSMFLAEEGDAPLPSRDRRAHKWSAGAVLVLGGSTGMVGASVLAGKSALDFGAGAVAVASPRVDIVQQLAPELLAFSTDDVGDRLGRFDVVVAGPGLAETDAEAVHPVLSKAERVVLDAGGLGPATLAAAREHGAEVVVTPHDGEFARLAGLGAGTFSIRSFAWREGVTVLRKGNPTMVTDGDLPTLVATGGPELASIGTGDVLSGMIGALWARGLGPTEAAVSGAYWHGVAGASLAARESVTSLSLSREIARFAW
jgi:hydroxyethylthiazole kinase-like uncharacterized protein yjeF